MSHLEIDLTNYVDMNSDLVPAGTYRALITDATEGVSSKGNRKIILGLKIIGGEFPGQDIGDARGARIVDQPVAQGAGLFRLAVYLRALGLWRGEQKKLNLDLGSLKGRQVMITVANGEPWNGRIKSEVQDVNRVPKAPKDPDSEPVFSGGLPVVVPPELRGRKMDSDEIAEAMGKIEATITNLESSIPVGADGDPIFDADGAPIPSPAEGYLGEVDGTEFSPIDLDNLTL